MLPEEIIEKPIITEKSNDQLQEGKYTFKVNKKATKVEIAKAVEIGKTPDWKKAIVTIDTNPEEKTYLTKGGKEVKVSKKYKDSIDEFMGA